MINPIRYSLIILISLLFGIFIFLPINELTSYYEYFHDDQVTVWQFIYSQFFRAITLQTPIKLFFYLIFGGLMGGVTILSLTAFQRRNHLIFQLKKELDKNLDALIRQGEHDELEFKSSFRFDYNLNKVNKALEAVIIKTLAGFMNTGGGSLLIGVSDNGSILGLDSDYNTLHRKDSDGFTQLIMSSIADKMGTPACRLVRILFQKVDDKEICRIIVMPSSIPVYVREDKQARFYTRTGSGTREMDVLEAVTFIKNKWR